MPKGQIPWNKRKPRADGFLWCSKDEHWCAPDSFTKSLRWCRTCSSAYHQSVRHKYVETKRKSAKKYCDSRRLVILTHYGVNGIPECHCCGERALEFLGIDHIDGGGCKHKKEVGNLYSWLVKNNFPEGFRDLCHNCNQSLGAYGYCPHQSSKTQ